MNLIKRIEEMKHGKRMLASSRFRRQVLQALDQALEQSGMTQTDLAKKLELSRSAVSQVFNGDGNLRAETISDYLFELGVHAEFLLIPHAIPETHPEYKATKELTAVSVKSFTHESIVILENTRSLKMFDTSSTGQTVAS